MPRRRRIDADDLTSIIHAVFTRHGFPAAAARQITSVLIAADLRGIDSHGVARLPFYHELLKETNIQRRPRIRAVKESASAALIDGGGGMGMVIGRRAMELCLAKAKRTGIGAVTVRNSNHYGIAGYYAMLALPRNCIGISMTNGYPFAAPTFGRQRLLGTNPIAFACPADGPHPFVLDMATTAVSVGKLQVARYARKPIPPTWAVDRHGEPTRDPNDLWNGGALLPLGSTAEASSYKGYGLNVMVDILCGALSGAACIASEDWRSPIEGRPVTTNTGHFFAAINLNAIGQPRHVKATVGAIMQTLKHSAKQRGQKRVYVAGEKEFEAEQERLCKGIPLYPDVLHGLYRVAKEVGVPERLLKPLGISAAARRSLAARSDHDRLG